MPLQLNDIELDALTGLPDLHVRLYIFGIRRYMDYATGIVGRKRGISYQSLSEVLYVEPIRGVKTPTCFSRSQLRRAVKALERAGLIAIKSQGLQLIFECVLATQDRSVQIKAVTRPTQQAVIETEQPEHYKTLENRGIFNKHAQQVGIQTDLSTTLKADTPPISGINKSTLSNESVVKKTNRSCALPDEFAVKSIHVDLANQNGWPNPYDEVDAFRDYHLARGNTMKDWDRAFYTWLRNAKHFGVSRHAKNQRLSRKSESVLRLFESCAPHINWRDEE
jgi:hypothetical protein